MKPGDLVQLFSRVDTHVWCWDQDGKDFVVPNGISAVIIRRGPGRRDDNPHAAVQVLCDGKVVWVHRAQFEVFDETR